MKIILWDIYEIHSKDIPITGVMFRGRIRKFYLEKNKNILTENTSDIEKSVRFALIAGESSKEIISYIHTIIPWAEIKKVWEKIPNPVLSKMRVNKQERYTL